LGGFCFLILWRGKKVGIRGGGFFLYLRRETGKVQQILGDLRGKDIFGGRDYFSNKLDRVLKSKITGKKSSRGA